MGNKANSRRDDWINNRGVRVVKKVDGTWGTRVLNSRKEKKKVSKQEVTRKTLGKVRFPRLRDYKGREKV